MTRVVGRLVAWWDHFSLVASFVGSLNTHLPLFQTKSPKLQLLGSEMEWHASAAAAAAAV